MGEMWGGGGEEGLQPLVALSPSLSPVMTTVGRRDNKQINKQTCVTLWPCAAPRGCSGSFLCKSIFT